MNTLQDDWRDYRDRIYPGGLPAVQNLELHQAFFAGALCYSQQMDALTPLPEPEAMRVLDRLKREVWEINSGRAHMARDRN